ncbi:U2 small nuclear ribonucleoprotein B'' [Actinomortierella ambigua]|uniref:U2 small nuclear ribonucleoprotein B n=1 Tax=Actinomortierella ambigua TaxID=1343610 RepID=A0A9P6UAM1_9FUNG|nr:U2 small nuclear ribonucleoprotein B'' [Actinomortierella ambigua]KAG0267903.1 U2 small nuclear ribonucleoprotein B'' [Actinomortierella ambigua]
MSEHVDPNQTIYVRNLNDKIKKDELKRSLYCLFSAFGRVISITALKTLPHRGQAFIAFSDLTSATAALRGLQGFEFYGKAMDIQYAKTKSNAIAKLDGTYKQPPLKKNGIESAPVAAAAKRAREADSDSDSD